MFNKLFRTKRIKKKQTIFKKKEIQLKQSFFGFKHLGKEIINYLLQIDLSKKKLNDKLIYLIFGKMALQKFNKKGINCDLPCEKSNLLEFTKEQLEGAAAHHSTQSSISQSFEGPSRHLLVKTNKIKSMNEFVKKHEWDELKKFKFLDENDLALKIEKIILSKVKRNCIEDVFKDFEFFEIKEKFVEHWNWLRCNSKFFHGKFVSFNFLLIQVFFIPDLTK